MGPDCWCVRRRHGCTPGPVLRLIAGVPSVYGLYGAFMPCIIYALFGSSKQLAVGPVAVTSLLIGNGMVNIVPGEHPQAAASCHCKLGICEPAWLAWPCPLITQHSAGPPKLPAASFAHRHLHAATSNLPASPSPGQSVAVPPSPSPSRQCAVCPSTSLSGLRQASACMHCQQACCNFWHTD